MGNLCTGDKQLEDQNQGLEFDDEDNHWGGESAQPPEFYVGSNLKDLPPDFKKSQKLSKLQELIQIMKSNQRKGKKLMAISRKHEKGGFLEDPYLITLIEEPSQAIYIGEWKFNKKISSSVPSGLGRLYKQDEIIEGQIITELDENETGNTKIKQDFLYQMIKENKRRAKFFKLKDTEAKITEEITTLKRLNVMLDGQGRIFSRTMEQMGEFKKGKLDGKGQISIRYDKDIYKYKGQFVQGIKEGKGLQEFKNVKYDGEFFNDEKEGHGRLTLFISHKFQKEEEQEQERIKLEYADRNSAQIISQIEEFIKRKLEFEEILEGVLKEELPWQGPAKKLKGIPFSKDAKFMLEHSRRTKFKEEYVGEFQKNEFNGYGKYTWFNGKCYDGEWKNGKMHGIGQFYWHTGMQYYFGEYQNDLKHGKGTIYWGLTKRYRGQWAFGLRHGYGELIQVKDITKPNEQNKKVAVKVIGGLFNKDKLEEKNIYFTYEKQFDSKCSIFDVEKEYEKMALIIEGRPFDEVEFMARMNSSCEDKQ